jgi:formamidopyrimidine-DNA glycosylase
MADEILWRARLHPRTPAGAMGKKRQRDLWRVVRAICRQALRIIGKDFSDPPRSWLFRHRWEPGGHCPRDGAALARDTVGGRTTAWCPRCQRMGEA